MSLFYLILVRNRNFIGAEKEDYCKNIVYGNGWKIILGLEMLGLGFRPVRIRKAQSESTQRLLLMIRNVKLN